MAHSREPVAHTCPNIDKVIKIVSQAMKDISDRSLRSFDDVDELKDHCSYIEGCLSDVDSLMEKLRSDNDALRCWGCEEADRVDELENFIYELQEQQQ